MITTTSTLKILLIEDNLAEARLLQEFIKLTKSQNFSLVHVQKLQEGINKLNNEKYDVILLDLTLPIVKDYLPYPSYSRKILVFPS